MSLPTIYISMVVSESCGVHRSERVTRPFTHKKTSHLPACSRPQFVTTSTNQKPCAYTLVNGKWKSYDPAHAQTRTNTKYKQRFKIVDYICKDQMGGNPLAAYRACSTRIAGIVVTAVFFCISSFQAALALGAPLGKAAWGGASSEISRNLRCGSAMAVFVWMWAAGVVYQRAGFGDLNMSDALVKKAMWVLAYLMCVGCALNFASRSSIERWIWGPTTLVLAVGCFILACSNTVESHNVGEGEESSLLL